MSTPHLADLDRRLTELQEQLAHARGTGASTVPASSTPISPPLIPPVAAPVAAPAPAPAPAPVAAQPVSPVIPEPRSVGDVPAGLPVSAPPVMPRDLPGAVPLASVPAEPVAYAPPAFVAPTPVAVPAAEAVPVPPPDPSTSESAVRVLADAQEQAARIVEHAEQRASAIRDQVEELLLLRDELDRSAQRIVGEYEAVRERIERRHAGVAPPLPDRAAVPTPEEVVSSELVDEPVAAPAAAAPTLTQEEAEQAFLFDGDVTVSIGPYTDLAALGQLEATLRTTPGISDVYLRGFEERHAVVELSLAGRVDLLTALGEALPTPFQVRDHVDHHLSLDLVNGTTNATETTS